MILTAALLAGALTPPASAAAAPLAERVSDVATRFCVDLVSRVVPKPAVGDEERRVFARYGLQPGIPDAALQALGPTGGGLVSNATLASGEASDGAFAVALGGAPAGGTCRVIIYRAPLDGLFVRRTFEMMKTPERGWKSLPPQAQQPGTLRLSLLKRDANAKPFIASLIAPEAPGPVAMIVIITAVPSTVTIPQGF